MLTASFIVSIETKQAMLRTRSNIVFFGTKGQVTPICPEYELRDFMPVPVYGNPFGFLPI